MVNYYFLILMVIFKYFDMMFDLMIKASKNTDADLEVIEDILIIL